MARIAGVDLPRTKRVEIGLTYIYGIGRHRSNDILRAAGVNPDIRIKDLSEDDVRKIEDRELELMEASEGLKPQIAEAEKENQAVKAQVAQQIADLDAKSAAISENVKKIEAERATIAGGVEEDLLDLYDRLFKTKGEAVVALEHDVCTGCHMKVTASTSARARAGKEVVNCEQCSRILYWTDL